MSFSVTFYKVSGDPRSLSRSKTSVTTYNNVAPYDGCDMMNPRILLGGVGQIPKCTHFYISETQRYYQLTGCEVTDGNRCIVSGSIDALLTWAPQLKASNQMVVRTADEEIAAEQNIADSLRPISPQKITNVINTKGNQLKTANTYIVTVLGGNEGKVAEKITDTDPGEYLNLDDGRVLKIVRG